MNVRSDQPGPPTSPDRPTSGSLEDLRQRLDRLPPSHPSSPRYQGREIKPVRAREQEKANPDAGTSEEHAEASHAGHELTPQAETSLQADHLGEHDRNPDSSLPTDIPRQFLVQLADLEQRLEDKQIPYALFGSLAASAYIDQGRSLDFNRPHAHDPTERVPDIDLLIPRDNLDRIKPYIEEVRNSDFPIKIDTFWAESWVDLRPDAEYSYLTHRDLRLPARTELFSPCKARLFGQEFTSLDPRTLLGLYGTVGVLRKQDVPRITGLIRGIASGTTPSRFTEQDCKVFDDFMHARKRRYPVFMASKRTWVGLLDTLPPPASRALKHHVQLRANEVFQAINRRKSDG